MAGLFEGLKTRDIKWSIILPILLAILCLFSWRLMESHRKMEAMQIEEANLRLRLTNSQKEETTLKLKLSSVGSTGSMDSEARAMSFVKPGEIRFEIVDAQLLDKYTEQEWKVFMEESTLGEY